MENNNISKLLTEYRKKKNITQKELGDMIGVSFKTISKWECGKGLPDVSLLDKISEVLEISIDDLLKGNNSSKHNNKKNIRYLLFIAVVLIVIVIILYQKYYSKNKEVSKEKEDYPCTMIGNYYIKLITDSNDENYKYITITMYQMEGIYSVKVPASIANQLSINKRYKFTLKTKENFDYITPDILFSNSKIINVAESLEDEIWSKYTCN